MLELLQSIENPLLGIIPYGTGVQENKIGLSLARNICKTIIQQNGCNNLTVGKIHLASVGFYVYIFSHNIDIQYINTTFTSKKLAKLVNFCRFVVEKKVFKK
jgi:hypothetical protein